MPLAGYSFNPRRPEGLRFKSPRPNSIDVSIDPSPDRFETAVVCRASQCVKVSVFVRDFVANLLVHRFAQYEGSPIVLPYIERGEEQIDKDGNIREGYGIRFEHYPAALQDICNTSRRELQDKVERFVKLLRWHQELDGPHVLTVGRAALYWNVDSDQYKIVSFGNQSSSGRAPAGITWDATDQSEFADLWSQQSVCEPLAHELLREAFGALESSPRSSLLMATSALETGIKMHIAELVPDAQWLLLESPSPPIFKMFRRYLFELHTARGTGIADWDIWSGLFKCVETVVNYRNKLAHTGALSPDVISELPGLLEQARDILYILDVLAGHAWAKQNVRHETRARLGWPPSRRKRMFVKMVVQ